MMPIAAKVAAAAIHLALVEDGSPYQRPDLGDIRLQKISRSGNEVEWPFSIDTGTIACVWSAGKKVVTFLEEVEAPDDEHEAPPGRYVIVSVNPFDLVFLNIANRDLFVPADTVETLIKRVAPFAALGERLCDQPRGTTIGPAEL